MTTHPKITAIALAAGLALLAAGCDDRPEDMTMGQRMDNTVADAKQQTRELGDTLEQKADQAGQAIDDAAITTTVKGKLLAADDLNGTDISVDTEQGVVTLRGRVPSDTARNRAVDIALNVDGVLTVDNRLTVN